MRYPIFIIDREFNILLANRDFVEVFGEWRGRKCYEIVDGNGKPFHACPVLQAEDVPVMEARCSRDRRFLFFAYPMENSTYIVTGREISDTMGELERYILRTLIAEEKLNALLEHSPIMIAIIDYNGTFIQVNEEVVKNIGYDPTGKTMYEVFAREVAEKRLKLVRKSIDENRLMLHIPDVRGDRHYVLSLVPLREGGGKLCLIIAREETEYVRLKNVLTATYRIITVSTREGKIDDLLNNACNELAKVDGFVSAGCLLLDEDRMYHDSFKGEMLREILPSCKLVEVVEKHAILSGEVCGDCDLCAGKFKQLMLLPMRAESVIGVFAIALEREVKEHEEIEIFQSLANDLALAVRAIRLDEIKARACENLSDVVMKMDVATHFIRNTVTALQGYICELVEDEEVRRKLIEQSEKIHAVIRLLEERRGDTTKLLASLVGERDFDAEIKRDIEWIESRIDKIARRDVCN